MIPRLIEKNIILSLKKNKIVLIFGARQVGKTTLLFNIKNKLKNKKILYLNTDILEEKSLINTNSLTQLKKITDKIDYLFIDEGQNLDNPGLTLKIIYDNLKSVKLVVTGSSSFQLKNKVTDALTGRYLDFYLYPLSLKEVADKKNSFYIYEDLLLYGSYPEVYLTKKPEEKIFLIKKIIESYLFKDIFTFQKIRYSQIIQELATSIAYQIGMEVNENELANRLKIDRKTVINYLDILEQAFVIKRLYPYSQNPRREIGKKYKIYFWDLGIRNGLIGDFNKINVRKDIGQLWENFLVIERLKKNSYENKLFKSFFWRSYNGAEVDYLEKSEVYGKLKGYEIKFSSKKLSRGAKEFIKKYQVGVEVVNQDNFGEFVY